MFLALVDISCWHLFPFFNIFNLDLANSDRSVTLLIDPVLHLLESLQHFGAEPISHIIQQSELRDAIEDSVYHFDIERRCHDEHERTHFLLIKSLFIIFFLVYDFSLQLFELILLLCRSLCWWVEALVYEVRNHTISSI